VRVAQITTLVMKNWKENCKKRSKLGPYRTGRSTKEANYQKFHLVRKNSTNTNKGNTETTYNRFLKKKSA